MKGIIFNAPEVPDDMTEDPGRLRQILINSEKTRAYPWIWTKINIL